MARLSAITGSAGINLFFLGFVAMLGQTVLLRELNVAFHGVELIYPIAIGGWLFSAAMGAISSKPWPSEERMASLFIVFSLFVMSGFLLLRSIIPFTTVSPENWMTPFKQIGGFMAVLLPSGFIFGMIFTETASVHAEKRGTPEGAYAAGAAGGGAGALLAYASVLRGFDNLSIMLFCVLLSSTVALLNFRNKKKSHGRFIAAGLIIAALALLVRAPSFDMRMAGWKHPGIFFSDDFPVGRLCAAIRNGSISVFENNSVVFTSKDFDGAAFAHIAALQHPDPRRILVIGGGWDGDVQALLQHKPVRIDVILPPGDPFIRFRLPADIRNSLANTAVHLSHDDLRRILKKGFVWDVILVNITAPLSCNASRFHTRDFFLGLAARLYKGGVVAVRLPAMDSHGAGNCSVAAAAVYQALASVFPERLILAGKNTLIAASHAPLPHSSELLTDRVDERNIPNSPMILSSSEMRKLFDNALAQNIENRFSRAVIPASPGTKPACHTYSALAWAMGLRNDWFASRIPGMNAPSARLLPMGSLVAAGILLLFAGSRLRPNWQRFALTAAGGFLGMACETLLILHCGQKEGILYQQLPLLLAAFMAGLSLGAPIFRDLFARTRAGETNNRLWGGALLIGFMLLNAVFTGIAKDSAGSLLAVISMSVATGFLTGGLFASANVYRPAGRQTRSRSLFAANLLGGALGAVLAGILLIPAWGIAATSVGLIIMAALAFLLV